MDTELDQKIEYFKKHLEFGNDSHILLVEKVGELEKLKRQLLSRNDEGKTTTSLEKRILELKRSIVNNITYKKK